MIASRTFEADLGSIRPARTFVATELDDLPPDVLEVVVLMASELATNSIGHAQTPFEIEVTSDDELVRVAVSDLHEDHPQLGDPDPRMPTGRGIKIVDRLADRWGVIDNPDGKTVWFEVDRAP